MCQFVSSVGIMNSTFLAKILLLLDSHVAALHVVYQTSFPSNLQATNTARKPFLFVDNFMSSQLIDGGKKFAADHTLVVFDLEMCPFVVKFQFGFSFDHFVTLFTLDNFAFCISLLLSFDL